ncbi:sodium/nucleoside cotransporter 1-like [Gracilinanus agilis]|uniref:sodium/nucleoside cotransporter 1-like n=1 Tax=Gracilinanus agilis TaxID=191870 RepID=UPI001CFC4F4D|nr:sodium/nucleoside cotransporter 1-like [Gracilinanus agilis]
MEAEKREKEPISLISLENGVENLGLELMEDKQNTEGTTLTKEEENHLKEEIWPLLFWRRSLKSLSKARNFCKVHVQLFWWILLGLMCVAYAAFLLAACVLDFQRALALFIFTCVMFFFLSHSLLFNRLFGKRLMRYFKVFGKSRLNYCLKWGIGAAILISLVLWLILDTSRNPKQLISFTGFCLFITILFICSKHHHAVSFRTVLWGLGLQFSLGIVVIRTNPGFAAFQWLGNQIQVFLDYTTVGSRFVFGDRLIQEVFAFQVLPIIVFFSCVMSVLYHMGLMQWLIQKIAWLMQVTMATIATETLSVAGNIFVGMTEAPLLIQPYLADMTLSEIHAMMTGGFATIAGSVMGAYMSFGIDSTSLIAASVMAAPCALALSKLVYPEVEVSKFKNEEGVILLYGEAQNLLEAVTNGAAISVGVVANIAANLIAFLAILAFINTTLSWLGEMVNIQGLSFQVICSFALRPIAFIMGVDWEDCPIVAEMLGIKFFLNEFVAYKQLSQYKNRRLSGIEEWVKGEKQWISVRAEIITTFALCGFANLGSIGIILGGLTSMVPQRKSDFSNTVISALLTGSCVSLVNACVAGILYVPRGAEANCVSFLNKTNFTTNNYENYVCCRDLFKSASLSLAVLNVSKSPSFSGLWEGVESGAETLANCCQLFNHTSCPP